MNLRRNYIGLLPLYTLTLYTLVDLLVLERQYTMNLRRKLPNQTLIIYHRSTEKVSNYITNLTIYITHY
jgi:hypothetical protein